NPPEVTMSVPFDQAALPEVDPMSESFRHEFVAEHARVHERAQVAKCPMGPYAVGYEMVRDLLKDKRLSFAGDRLPRMFNIDSGAWYEWWTTALINDETEAHTMQRRIVAAAFTPKKADAARPIMREIIEPLVAEAVNLGTCSFVDVVARQY